MKFVLDQPGNTHEAVREVIEGGTRTYGLHMNPRYPRNQVSDLLKVLPKCTQRISQYLKP